MKPLMQEELTFKQACYMDPTDLSGCERIVGKWYIIKYKIMHSTDFSLLLQIMIVTFIAILLIVFFLRIYREKGSINK